jgi:hypothetical protein
MSKDTLNAFIENTANPLLVSDLPSPIEEKDGKPEQAVERKPQNKALVRLFDVLRKWRSCLRWLAVTDARTYHQKPHRWSIRCKHYGVKLVVWRGLSGKIKFDVLWLRTGRA